MDKSNIEDQFSEFISEGVNGVELLNIFSMIPDSDTQDMSFLELATRCILEVSSVVDDAYPNLDRRSRLTKKYIIMSKLLEIKASDLIK